MSRRQSLPEIVRGYDRLARVYSRLEWLYLIFPAARRKAVRALSAKPGDTILEIGAGTGRNLPYLIEAVAPGGKVIAVDASPGMLAEARKLIEREGWSNVELIHEDAARLELDQEVDGVLFSLSYSVLPERRPSLARAWERLRPGARLVVMDMGLTGSRLHRLLAPVGWLLLKLAPGDPYSEPWNDLAEYGAVATDRFLLGFYYVCAVSK
jgi:ubiquinone/menaquinone biosynthesis C-methylase UbiE